MGYWLLHITVNYKQDVEHSHLKLLVFFYFADIHQYLRSFFVKEVLSRQVNVLKSLIRSMKILASEVFLPLFSRWLSEKVDIVSTIKIF